jgi:hypothetical protein
LRWRHGHTVYEILVENPGHSSRGIAAALLDGAPVEPEAIPLFEDGAVHRLLVTMGEPAPVQSAVG